MKKRVLAAIVLLIIVFMSSSCFNSERQQERIKEMFESFPVAEEKYVLITSDFVFVGDKQILRSDLKFEGEKCRHLACLEDGMYAYTYVSGTDNASANILRIPYDTLLPELVVTITVDTSITGVNYRDGGLYFRAEGSESEDSNVHRCLIYDIKTGKTRTEIYEDVVQIDKGFYNNRSKLYSVTRNIDSFSDYYEVTEKASGKTKQITKNVLKSCEEGKAILKKGKLKTAITTIQPVYEKDGAIYLFSNMLDDGVLGYPNHCFILKYDFESETADFYTWVYCEDYQKVVDFYIPQNIN